MKKTKTQSESVKTSKQKYKANIIYIFANRFIGFTAKMANRKRFFANRFKNPVFEPVTSAQNTIPGTPPKMSHPAQLLSVHYFILLVVLMLASMLLLSSCTVQSEKTDEKYRVENPASIYCENQGHKYTIKTDTVHGGEKGYCIFPDGSECDEWEYMNGKCSPSKEIVSVLNSSLVLNAGDVSSGNNAYGNKSVAIYRELIRGMSDTIIITLENSLRSSEIVNSVVSTNLKDLLFFEDDLVEIPGMQKRDIIVKVVIPKDKPSGDYEGTITLDSGRRKGIYPVRITVLQTAENFPNLKIYPLRRVLQPGELLKVQYDLLRVYGTSEYTNKSSVAMLNFFLLNPDTNEIIIEDHIPVSLSDKVSAVYEMNISKKIMPRRYILKGTSYYLDAAQKQQSVSTAYIEVQYPYLLIPVLGIPMWAYILGGFLLVFGISTYSIMQYFGWKKKRFKVKTELDKLPQFGPNAIYVGKVAEVGAKTYLDLNKLQMHTLIAGATGGGKTVAAQGLVESALMHKKSVVVFDPTAQWTGLFRKCTDKNMLRRYAYFDMKKGEARSFEGTIKKITDPYEIINIKKYMERPGEITVFDVSSLSPKEIDIVVANTIQQVFKSAPEESQELKTLLVYDEVHRLLPKFGGTGEGFVQIERGAREFRKWGYGLFLISQVLSDFIGEIKANIGTEIQMGTRYEGDLNRISTKYGEEVLKSVVREPIGTGMVVNAEYNNGKPYFVSFRPLLHNTQRMTKQDIMQYQKYFMELEDMEYQIDLLKQYGTDVLDLQMEYKLSRSKVQKGQFQVADMYLESLRPRLEGEWKKIGKEQAHLFKATVSKDELEASIKQAKLEREKYIKEANRDKGSEVVGTINASARENDAGNTATHNNITNTTDNNKSNTNDTNNSLVENQNSGQK